jgi:nitric oxide reductase subunit B
VEQGYWYARSAEFMQTPTMNTLRWMRVIGDTTFAVGAVILVLFVAGLATGHSFRPGHRVPTGRRPEEIEIPPGGTPAPVT